VDNPTRSKKTGYYACVVLSWVFLSVGLFCSGAGKTQPNQTGVTLAWVLSLLAVQLMIAAIWISIHKGPMRIAEPVVTLGIFAVCAAIVVPVLHGARGSPASSVCLSNTKRIVTASAIYAADNNDCYPDKGDWGVKVLPYTKETKPLKCPTASVPYSYAMNAVLSGIHAEDVRDEASTVLVFECSAQTPNPSGGEETFVDRHNHKGSVGFVDGHAKLVQPGSREVRWKP
jgi:prepilin-type processing-associated H-X9-DG protein